MDENEKQEMIEELKSFYKQLKSYKKRLEANRQASKAQKRYTGSLREKLVRKSSTIKGLIKQLTQKQYYTQFRQVREIWDEGLNPGGFLGDKLTALDYCIDATNEAIGKLELDIKQSKVGKEGNEIEKPSKKRPLSKGIRKQLSGTPEELTPHIIRVSREFRFTDGFNCYGEEESYETSPFSKRFMIYRITGGRLPHVGYMGAKPEELPYSIGIISLQSLPNNKTLFIAKYALPSCDSEGSYFDSYLERLSLEFKNLGIEETAYRKTWRWFKGIIEVWNKLKP